MSYDLVDLYLDAFRSSGRMLRAGVAVRVPALPRSKRARMALEREARRDPHVRKAYEAALAKVERTRQIGPMQTIRRDGLGKILSVE